LLGEKSALEISIKLAQLKNYMVA